MDSLQQPLASSTQLFLSDLCDVDSSTGTENFMKKETEKPTVLLHDHDRQYCRCREFSWNKVVCVRDRNKKVHESTSTCQKCSSVNLIF